MATLPGTTPVTGPLPPLPGTTPLTTEDRARAKATEAQWAALRDAPVTLADLILFVNTHPELVQWAQEYKVRLNLQPGVQP
jgi:hypothetical protein